MHIIIRILEIDPNVCRKERTVSCTIVGSVAVGASAQNFYPFPSSPRRPGITLPQVANMREEEYTKKNSEPGYFYSPLATTSYLCSRPFS